MTAEGHTVASLTGAVEGSRRDAVIDAFRNGDAKVLITTNVLARGIDVSTVSLVVNYVCSLYNKSWHGAIVLTALFRIFPKLSAMTDHALANLIIRLICTVLAALAVSAVLVSPFRLCRTAKNGTCCARSSSILAATLNVWILTTGTRWRA